MNVVIQRIRKNVDEFLRPPNVYMAQRPLIWMCRMVGLLPFVVVYKNALSNECITSIRVSRFCLILPFVFIGIFTLSFATTLVRGDSFSTYFVPTELSGFVSFTLLTIFFMAVVTIYTACFWHRQKLIRIFDMFHSIDMKLRETSSGCMRVAYAKTVRYMLVMMASHSLLYALKWLLTYVQQVLLDRTPTANVWVSYFMSHVILFIATLMFWCIVRQLHYRFRLLNEVSDVFLLHLYPKK